MIPDGWRILTFSEFATLQRGFDLKQADRQPGHVPVAAASGIIGTHDRAKVHGPGVVTGRSGTIGRVNYLEEDFWPLNTTLYVKDFHGNRPRFVAYFLEFFDLARFATGTGVRTLNRNRVHPERVVVPSIAEQQRIVNLLSAVDRTLDAARRVTAQNDRLAIGMRSRLLRQGIGCHSLRSSRVGDIPEAWDVLPLGQLCRFRNGHSFRTEDWADRGLPIIRIQNLNGSRMFKFFAGPPKPSWIVEPGDLLFAWAGSKKASLGPTLWNGPRGVLNQHIFRIEPATGIDKLWLHEVLNRVVVDLASRARGFKATLQHLRKSDLMQHLVARPPSLEQRLIARHCAHVRTLGQTQQRALEHLWRLRAGLLQELMTGKVRTQPS